MNYNRITCIRLFTIPLIHTRVRTFILIELICPSSRTKYVSDGIKFIAEKSMFASVVVVWILYLWRINISCFNQQSKNWHFTVTQNYHYSQLSAITAWTICRRSWTIQKTGGQYLEHLILFITPDMKLVLQWAVSIIHYINSIDWEPFVLVFCWL